MWRARRKPTRTALKASAPAVSTSVRNRVDVRTEVEAVGDVRTTWPAPWGSATAVT